MQTEGRVFSSRYKPDAWIAPSGGCLVIPLLVLPGLAFVQSLGLGLAIAILATLAYVAFTRLRRASEPVLMLSDAGVRLDGLGEIAWSKVESVRQDPDRTEGGPLILRLRQQLGAPGMLKPSGVSPLWSVYSEDSLAVHVRLLEDPAEEIVDAFSYFLRRDAR